MQIRAYRQTDIDALLRLFYETVHTINAADYSAQQLDAWTGRDLFARRQSWNASFLKNDTLVAVIDHTIAGFADMEENGYLNRLYVHKDFQRRGVATALCDVLESKRTGKPIVVHASVTAKPFFEKRGYVTLRAQQVERDGVFLTNYVMQLVRKTI